MEIVSRDAATGECVKWFASNIQITAQQWVVTFGQAAYLLWVRFWRDPIDLCLVLLRTVQP